MISSALFGVLTYSSIQSSNPASFGKFDVYSGEAKDLVSMVSKQASGMKMSGAALQANLTESSLICASKPPVGCCTTLDGVSVCKSYKSKVTSNAVCEKRSMGFLDFVFLWVGYANIFAFVFFFFVGIAMLASS